MPARHASAPADPSEGSPMVIGHRGAPGYRPEHTSAGYELAFAQGADAVEPDVVATRDGVLVLRHENEISGTTDVAAHREFAGRRATKLIDGVETTGWFTEDFTWAELSTLRARERLGALRPESARFDGRFPLMRLSELFTLIDRATDAAGRALAMVAEIKHPTYFSSVGLPLDELFAAEVFAAGWKLGEGRLILESFEATVLAELHDRGVTGKRIHLIEDSGAPFDQVAALGERAHDYAESVSDAGLRVGAAATGRDHLDGISVKKSLILPSDAGADPEQDSAGPQASDLVRRAHEVGLEVYCWTLRPENRFLTGAFRGPGDDNAFGHWRREFEVIMRTGVDGVFADQPDLAVAARGPSKVGGCA
ncbi:MAG: glycerophosphodiester phosphodiesterase family protein [Microbacteriaceae bacterium]